MRPPPADRLFAELDQPWQEAFRQAWEALRTGNIAVGACASTPDGKIIHAARNRVNDSEGPAGEIYGSSLAHAEMNVLARLPFDGPQDLVLTTTLQPCLQCAAAIRFGPVGTIRFAGADRYWDGCHDFGKLSVREAQRVQVKRIGPRQDELGAFATLIARLGRFTPGYEQALRRIGEGLMADLIVGMRATRELDRLAAMDLTDALAHLWPQLTKLTAAP